MFTYRFTRLFVVALLASGLLAIALIWGLLASGTRADAAGTPAGVVRYVSPSGNDTGNDCLNSGAPCQSVQHAINLAQEADEIRVASGIYTGIMTSFIPAWNDNVTATVVITKNIGALLGGFNADFSLRDPDLNITKLSASAAPGDYVIFISGTTTLVNGFTITGSDGSNTGYGAGVRINGGSPKLQNNHILGNHAPLAGGGIYVTNNAAPVIVGNIIESNTSSEGAGIYVRSGAALIAENKIRSNAAGRGGGIFVRNAPVMVISNTIYLNTAVERGGGVQAIGDSTVIDVSHNEVFSNSVTSGGGSGLNISVPAVVNGNSIHHNRTVNWGAAILIADVTSPVTLTNNVIANNYGIGIQAVNSRDVRIINNTVAHQLDSTGNPGNGIDVWVDITGTEAKILNNLVTDNAMCGYSAQGNVSVTADYNNAYHNRNNYCTFPIGAHNLNADPLFRNSSAGDYHIGMGSPAMDTGTRIGAPAYDREGVARPQGSGVDMGAYEINMPHTVYLPLTMKR